MAYDTLPQVAERRQEGMRPPSYRLRALQWKYESSVAAGLTLPEASHRALVALGISPRPVR